MPSAQSDPIAGHAAMTASSPRSAADPVPRLVLVAAMGRNRVIGVDGRMPWHLPADLAHFKQLTLGHPVLMGRRTFESIGRALPGRRNIVLSRTLDDAPAGTEIAGSLDQALEMVDSARPVMVIGGGELYRQALPRAGAMELTLVDAAPGGDTRFPDWDATAWVVTAQHVRPADPANAHRLVFCSFRRGSLEGAEDE